MIHDGLFHCNSELLSDVDIALLFIIPCSIIVLVIFGVDVVVLQLTLAWYILQRRLLLPLCLLHHHQCLLLLLKIVEILVGL